MTSNDEICCLRFDPEPWDGTSDLSTGVELFPRSNISSTFLCSCINNKFIGRFKC